MLNTEHVCLELPADSESELGELSRSEKKMALWSAENEAIIAAKEFSYCCNPIGEAGIWSTSTERHNVTWYWRYSGLHGNVPAFSINQVICESKNDQTEVNFGLMKVA